MENFALPFSLQYSKIFSIVLIIAASGLYFYLSLLLGSVILTYYYNYKQKVNILSQFDFDFIYAPIRKPSLPIVLGVLPYFVLITLDFVWLQGNEFDQLRLTSIISFVFLLISLSFFMAFKYSFQRLNPQNVLEKVENDQANFQNVNINKRVKIFFFITSIFLIISFVLTLGVQSSKLFYTQGITIDLVNVFTKPLFWVKLFYFFSLAISFSLLYYLFNLYFDKDRQIFLEQESSIARMVFSYGLFFIFVQPALLFLELLIFPTKSLSYWIFISSGLIILLLFIVANNLNAFKKEENTGLAKFAFYLMIVSIILLASRDSMGLYNVLVPKFVKVSQDYAMWEEELKSKLNIKTVVINGKDIFNVKCSACHRFDSKLVGPPYNEVLSKYVNNKSGLVKFILNPVKVNSEYPPMPAQGLIPTEAEAVADYILKVYQENSNK